MTHPSAAIRSVAPPRIGPAAAWLARRVVRTPVVRCAALDRQAGVRLWLKAENLQHAGSYKFRGALRAVGRLAEAGGHPGVIAQSTGNHALAIALAAQRYGMAATVVLPRDAAPVKVARARSLGAQVVLAGTALADRLDEVERLHRATGYPVVDSYDHPDVVAGQGTATRELVEQVRELGGRLDAVVVPVGGGGGVAGACLAVRELAAAARRIAVHGVEPVGCDALNRSLQAGERVTVEPGPTLADGLRTATIGALPFAIARRSVAGVLTVSDTAIADALCRALFDAKLLVEPSAAAALAGALELGASGGYADIGVLLTGGNVDPALIAGLIGAGAHSRFRDVRTLAGVVPSDPAVHLTDLASAHVARESRATRSSQ